MANDVSYPKLWEPTQITDAETTIFTASTVTSVGVVKNMSATITNTGSAGYTVELWQVPSGGSTGDSNKRLNNIVIPINSEKQFTLSDMKNGDFIVVKASITLVTTIHSDSGIIIN